MSSYGTFAQYYDVLTRNVQYAARADALQRCIEKWQSPEEPEHILLDLACGTGSLAEEFARRGWDVIAVDRSAEMLNEALDKKYDSGLPVQYLQQDMRALNLFGTISVTVCALDSLNHLSEEQDIRRTFERVNLFSNAGALFLFDVNTEYKHRQVLAEECFVYEPEGAFIVWQNHLREQAPDWRVTVQLDFFEQLPDGKWRRETEEFSERIFSPETLEQLLHETGFTLLEVLDGDTFSAPEPQTQRLLYIARAKGGQTMPADAE